VRGAAVERHPGRNHSGGLRDVSAHASERVQPRRSASVRESSKVRSACGHDDLPAESAQRNVVPRAEGAEELRKVRIGQIIGCGSEKVGWFCPRLVSEDPRQRQTDHCVSRVGGVDAFRDAGRSQKGGPFVVIQHLWLVRLHMAILAVARHREVSATVASRDPRWHPDLPPTAQRRITDCHSQ
jgi:hypothetical protein